jgi:transporter family protein
VNWFGYALVSAGAAALTAILGKIGVSGVPSTLATAIRTVVIVVFAWAMAVGLREHHALPGVSRRSLLFLVLSGLATGVSWLAYYRALQLAPASRVAPIDKLNLPLTIVLASAFLRAGQLAPGHRRGTYDHRRAADDRLRSVCCSLRRRRVSRADPVRWPYSRTPAPGSSARRRPEHRADGLSRALERKCDGPILLHRGAGVQIRVAPRRDSFEGPVNAWASVDHARHAGGGRCRDSAGT